MDILEQDDPENRGVKVAEPLEDEAELASKS